ncbi:MAG: hypothetical protein FJ004_05195 [Chloroflexi bacterium]|nr:hypothetical protein [Chloroflexota bacterium]
MRTKSTVLTQEERDIIIMCAITIHGEHCRNSEIAKRLGVPIGKVKRLIHQACLKLGAHNRNEAVYFAIMQREISLNEAYPLHELAEILKSASPAMLRRIARLVRQGLEHGYLPGENEPITCTKKKQDMILTKRERDVLTLACRGLSNKEIADRLCISTSAVMTFLNRACRKLGARRRADAMMLAITQREIDINEIGSFGDLVWVLAPLGAEPIEKLAQLLDQKLGQEPVPLGS